jgi:hypothetical protein
VYDWYPPSFAIIVCSLKYIFIGLFKCCSNGCHINVGLLVFFYPVHCSPSLITFQLPIFLCTEIPSKLWLCTCTLGILWQEVYLDHCNNIYPTQVFKYNVLCPLKKFPHNKTKPANFESYSCCFNLRFKRTGKVYKLPFVSFIAINIPLLLMWLKSCCLASVFVSINAQIIKSLKWTSSSALPVHQE